MKDSAGPLRGQGKDLMALAFQPGGPLADPDGEEPEVNGVKFLFMGAVGALRNPVAHREGIHDDAAKVASMIVFADLLLRTVDEAVTRNEAAVTG